MKIEKWFYVFIVLIIISFILFLIFSFFNNKGESVGDVSGVGEIVVLEEDSPNLELQETNESPSGGNEGVEDGGDGVDNSGGGGGAETLILPSNWRTYACGIFYEEFEVCGGVCLDGVCVNEGRSCYCKE